MLRNLLLTLNENFSLFIRDLYNVGEHSRRGEWKLQDSRIRMKFYYIGKSLHDADCVESVEAYNGWVCVDNDKGWILNRELVLRIYIFINYHIWERGGRDYVFTLISLVIYIGFVSLFEFRASLAATIPWHCWVSSYEFTL